MLPNEVKIYDPPCGSPNEVKIYDPVNVSTAGVPPPATTYDPSRPPRLTTDQELIERLRDLAWEECQDMAKAELLHDAVDRLEQLTRYLP